MRMLSAFVFAMLVAGTANATCFRTQFSVLQVYDDTAVSVVTGAATSLAEAHALALDIAALRQAHLNITHQAPYWSDTDRFFVNRLRNAAINGLASGGGGPPMRISAAQVHALAVQAVAYTSEMVTCAVPLP